MTLDTTIGVYCGGYEDTHLITIGGLCDELHATFCFCAYTAKQFCDWRYSTCLQRFVYDPYTGEKLDWKKIREMLENGR